MAPRGYTASSSHLADAEPCNEPLDSVDGRRHLGRGTKGTSARQAFLLCACVALQTFQKLQIPRRHARQHDGCIVSAMRVRHLSSAPLDVHMILLLLHRGLALRKQLRDTRSVMRTDTPSVKILRPPSQSPVGCTDRQRSPQPHPAQCRHRCGRRSAGLPTERAPPPA
jgi:hypothetical protein